MTGDLYVLAYSWQPEFCYGKVDYYGCDNPQDYWKKFFTLHGLWPQYSTTGYPSYCTDEPFNSTVPEVIGMDTMTKYWPNAQYNPDDYSDYTEFWEHEWTKHGTCSGLDQITYFNTTINLLQTLTTSSLVTNSVGSTVNANDLRNDYGGNSYVALQCESTKYLSGIFTCWSQVNGIPNKQVECPAEVQGEDTCTVDTISVSSF